MQYGQRLLKRWKEVRQKNEAFNCPSPDSVLLINNELKRKKRKLGIRLDLWSFYVQR